MLILRPLCFCSCHQNASIQQHNSRTWGLLPGCKHRHKHAHIQTHTTTWPCPADAPDRLRLPSSPAGERPRLRSKTSAGSQLQNRPKLRREKRAKMGKGALKGLLKEDPVELQPHGQASTPRWGPRVEKAGSKRHLFSGGCTHKNGISAQAVRRGGQTPPRL